MKQYPVELHCHTKHSDGDFETEELIKQALEFGYKGLILTDHNTVSGCEEIIEKELDKEIVFLKGIEWTTYFGHMLVHDARQFVDWRTATIDTIDLHIRQVKAVEGLVGLAHPYAIGSPICTGCHWDFEVENWSRVDYIEIWNRTNPHQQFWSEKAYQLWTDLLKEGYRISASTGRDWHRLEGKDAAPGVTYVQTKENLTPETMKAALKKGAMYLTLAPRINISLSNEETRSFLGDEISAGKYNLQIQVLPADLGMLAVLEIEPRFIRIVANEKIIEDIPASENVIERTLNCVKGYIRIEVYGKYRHQENVRLLIANPIYVI